MGQSRLTLLLIGLLLCPSSGWAGQGVNPETGRLDLCLTLEETDGSPSNAGCGIVSVTNGALTDDGDGTFTLDVTAGGGGNSFETLSVPAGTNPVADSSTDTLAITEDTFLTLTGTAATDTIAITQVTTDIGTDGLIAANAVALTTDTTGNYAAGDAEAGAALTGDSATSFFSAGTLEVGIGGTGATTLTDGGLLLGSGTGAITPLGVATNGQIPIGDGTTDPVLNEIDGTANQVTVTNGAATITLSTPQDIATTSSPTFGNIALTGVGPDVTWNPTGGDVWHAGAESGAEGGVWFFSNTTDTKHLIRASGGGNLYFPQLSNCDLKTGADGKLYCGADATSEAGSGDITEVTAGSGLTGGGTTGAVTLTVGADTGMTVNADDVALTVPVVVANGGTGATTLTDGGILLGSGTGAITALGVASNGQVPIGDGTTDPVLATLTAVAGETDVTNGAGTITIGIADPIAVSKTSLTAGRSLTLTTNDVAADAELFTDTKCVWWENPVATDDFKSVWFAKQAATITSLWCESDQTVTAMFQVDDGTPADVDTVDLTCDATPPEDTALNGDAGLAAGDRLDIDVASVASTPTWVSMCFTFTYDD